MLPNEVIVKDMVTSDTFVIILSSFPMASTAGNHEATSELGWLLRNNFRVNSLQRENEKSNQEHLRYTYCTRKVSTKSHRNNEQWAKYRLQLLHFWLNVSIKGLSQPRTAVVTPIHHCWKQGSRRMGN